MHTASYEFLMKPEESSWMSPDPLLVGGGSGDETIVERLHCSMAIDKFFSLGMLAFTTHHNCSCVLCAMCYSLHIDIAKIWGCFSTPKHPLVYGLV